MGIKPLELNKNLKGFSLHEWEQRGDAEDTATIRGMGDWREKHQNTSLSQWHRFWSAHASNEWNLRNFSVPVIIKCIHLGLYQYLNFKQSES